MLKCLTDSHGNCHISFYKDNSFPLETCCGKVLYKNIKSNYKVNYINTFYVNMIFNTVCSECLKIYQLFFRKHAWTMKGDRLFYYIHYYNNSRALSDSKTSYFLEKSSRDFRGKYSKRKKIREKR